MKKVVLLAVMLLALAINCYAAEVAIMWNWESPEPDGYKFGDIVAVLPDGSAWGTSIDPRINPESRFIIVQITGVPVADFNQYFQPLYDWTDPENPVLIKKRQFKLDEGKVPQNIKNNISKNNGFVTITIDQWNAFITNKEGQL